MAKRKTKSASPKEALQKPRQLGSGLLSKSGDDDNRFNNEIPHLAAGQNTDRGDDSRCITETCCISAIRNTYRLKRQLVALRIQLENSTVAAIAVGIGFGDDYRKNVKAVHEQARKLMKLIDKDRPIPTELKRAAAEYSGLISASGFSRDAYTAQIRQCETQLAGHLSQFPSAFLNWIAAAKGLGIQNVASIIGEAGDLANYSTISKLYKRFGLLAVDGKMPSTHRREGSLTKEQWTKLGYSPRRRSIMYVVGDCLIKGNKKGEYRKLYLTEKRKAARRVGWSKLRAHRHASLLMQKQVLLDLWIQWKKCRGAEWPRSSDTEPRSAA